MLRAVAPARGGAASGWPLLHVNTVGHGAWQNHELCRKKLDPSDQRAGEGCPALGERRAELSLCAEEAQPQALWERVTAIHPQCWAPGLSFLES